MKRLTLRLIHTLPYAALGAIALGAWLAVSMWIGTPPAHALPEYATRTGEPCATCHVNPGGGGPRTLRGLLWSARSRPDQVPTLPGVLIAPGVRDGAELYLIACAACHGTKGEGTFGRELSGTSLREGKIRTTVLNGRARSGMPAFEGQFTPDQLATLVTFVAGLASGEITPPPDSYPLPPAEFKCTPIAGPMKRRGN